MVLANRVVCPQQQYGKVWQSMAKLVRKVARLPMFASVLWRGILGNVGERIGRIEL